VGRSAAALRLDASEYGPRSQGAAVLLTEFDLSAWTAAMRLATWNVSLWQLASLLVTALLAYLMVHRVVLRPLQAIHRSMERRSAGARHERAPELANDELGGLASTFNRMLDVASAQQERISTLVRNVPGAVYRCSLDDRWTMQFVSQAIESITGYPAHSFLGDAARSYSGLIHPDDLLGMQRAVRDSVGRRSAFELEYRVIHASGDWRWVHERGRVVVGPDASATWIDGVIWDVTERKRAEQRLEDYVLELEERKSYIEAQADLLREQAGELARARDRALDGARAKSEFLATMSHEIRTPMNGVLGMAELLLACDLEPHERDLAQTLQSSGEALLSILNDVLDFSKMEAGQVELEQVEFDPVDALEDAAELFAERSQAKGVEIVVRAAAGLPQRVLGDPGRLRQVLLNLVSNAVKFTERGRVVLSVERLPAGPSGRARLSFEVADSGIGIPAQTVPRLFHPFTQADASTTRRYGGTGLGLVIARRLVQLMGGDIEVHSEVGVGSRFRFSTEFADARSEPVASAHAGRRMLIAVSDEVARAALAERLEVLGADVVRTTELAAALDELQRCAPQAPRFDLLVFEAAGDDAARLAAWRERGAPLPATLRLVPFAAPAVQDGPADMDLRKPLRRAALGRAVQSLLGAATPAPALPAQRDGPLVAASPRSALVLLVEDNPVNQKLAVALLRRMGHRVDLANDGREALEAAEKRRYDVILMDCQMPVLDGFDATRELRRRMGESERTPVVAMTANALEGDRERCLEAGMDEYLTKPVRPARLAAVIERFLTGRVQEGAREA
jgi:PAS domain S-box-containing protein